MSTQIPLNLSLRDRPSLNSFFIGRNRELLDRLQALIVGNTHERILYLWGDSGTGKTHLLHGACELAEQLGKSSMVLSLEHYPELTPLVLEGLEDNILICIDNIHCVSGDDAWQAGLFGLYERLAARDGLLLVSAMAPPMHSGLDMSELRTRLAAGLVYQLQGLSDGDKLVVLHDRAQRCGLDLPEEVARYILQRYPRDLPALFGVLERLDKMALATQRRLTIPLVRSLE